MTSFVLGHRTCDLTHNQFDFQVDGNLTLESNVADVRGLRLAYKVRTTLKWHVRGIDERCDTNRLIVLNVDILV